MTGFLFTVLIFIFVLSALVLIHEFGHYGVARFLGIRVKELGLGFPPRIAAFKRGGIDYSINAIPFGGFVRLDGEDDPYLPGGYAGKPILVRTAVIVAGSAMNLLLAWAIFSVLVALPYQRVHGDITVQGVQPDSPAAAAGLQQGDVIDQVNSVPVDHTAEMLFEVAQHAGELVTLRVLRGETPLAVTVTPRVDPAPDQGYLGVSITLENQTVTTERIPIWQAPVEGLRMGFVIMGFVGQEVGRWIGGQAEPEIAGPVGIAQVTGEAARMGALPLLQVVALLSLNLGILNLLPIPALDGGRLPFLLLEAIRGRRMSPQRENLIHLIGFAVLLTFILFVTIGVDIPRILSGEDVLP
jgi:regulator of sigma E protease